MKCVQSNLSSVNLYRVPDEKAARLVASGWGHYVPKSKWKALRTPEQLAEIKKMQQQQMPASEYYGVKEKK
jgi:hypothetical protein